jgi:alpha-galactosidase
VPITFDPASGTFVLRTPSTAYALRLADGAPRHVYWAGALEPERAAIAIPVSGDGDEVPGEELSAEGGPRFGPPGLRVEFADGTRAVRWRHAVHDIDAGHLRIGLVDEHCLRAGRDRGRARRRAVRDGRRLVRPAHQRSGGAG